MFCFFKTLINILTDPRKLFPRAAAAPGPSEASGAQCEGATGKNCGAFNDEGRGTKSTRR